MLKNSDIALLLRIKERLSNEDVILELSDLIDREVQAKKKASRKVSDYHKTNPSKHNEYNKQWYSKKKHSK